MIFLLSGTKEYDTVCVNKEKTKSIFSSSDYGVCQLGAIHIIKCSLILRTPQVVLQQGILVIEKFR